MSIDAVKDRTKTVTRRHVGTWKDLKPGDRLTLIEKGMGLPKGTKQVALTEVEITDVRVETLRHIDLNECRREGFPDMSPLDFMIMWARSHGYTNGVTHGPLHAIQCRRIEWRYIDGGAS
jgi:hypothetical protein